MTSIETKLNRLRVKPPSDDYELTGLNIIATARQHQPKRVISWALAASLLISIGINVYQFGQVRGQPQITKPILEQNLYTPTQVQFISIPGVKDTPQVIIMESRL